MADELRPVTPAPTKKPAFRNRLARSMVLALLTFAVIPVSVMGLAGYLRARSLLQEQVASQLHNISEIQVGDLEQSIRTKEIRLDRIGRRPAFLEAAERLHKFYSVQYAEQLLTEFNIVNRPDGVPVFDNFFIVDHAGVIFGASKEEWIGVSLAESPYYAQLGEEVGTTGVYDFEPIYANQFTIFSKLKLFETNGDYLGILVGITEGETIRNYLNDITGVNPSTSAYFISSNDIFVGVDPYTKALTSFTPEVEQRQLIDEYLASTFVGDHAENPLLEFNNQLDIPVVAHAHAIDRINGDLVVEIPRDIAFGQLGSLAPFSIFLFFITLLVMGVVLWMATNRVVNPLLELASTTQNFAEGDWASRSPIKRNDEIGALAHSFNQMADDLTSLYTSLSHQVDERTEYIRTAAEVAQNIVSTFNIDELLRKTAHLIVERFGYYHTGIFMVERSGRVAILRAAHGPAAEQMLTKGHRLEVGSSSIVGWVTANNRPRAASDVGDDPVHFKNELLPETRAEVGIPIAIGDTVLGVLDVQSTHPEAFDEATISVLVTLSNQIATAIQNVNLFESSDVNLHELERLYRASKEVAQEKTLSGLLEATSHTLQDSPFITAIFTDKGKGVSIYSFSDPDRAILPSTLPEFIDIPLEQLAAQSEVSAIFDLGKLTQFPKGFVDVPRKMGCQAISLIPIGSGDELAGVLMLGSLNKEHLTETAIQPYVNLVDMVGVTLDKILASELTERRLSELEAISIMNQTMATAEELDSLYPALHEQVRQILGDYSFVVALYDDISDTIQIPYLYENGELGSLAPFPLGEGLTSIIIHTGQPLMIVEDTEKRSTALGAKLVGQPAKSWLGSPLHLSGKVIGALIIQDLEHERSFDENSLRFVNTLASQVSGAIHNIRLLEESRQRTIQLESAAEIARDISSSLHLDELLNRAVTMIRDRFDLYHASVFLIDQLGEYAIIRESTGEAGAQLKRNGHKLGVGSKSIVGYVSGRGESLIIENTDKDATYYANPLLPDTRAEAALPLKVGERILGVLDIQSTKPYVFSDEILQILTIIADQLAVAVINTELFADTQEHLSQHRLLHHITTSAASGTTLEEALQGAVQGLQVTLGGDRVAILLADEKEQSLKIGAAIGYSEDDLSTINIPIGNGVTGWAARNQKTVRIDNAPEDPRYISISANTRSELAVPLLFRKELLGVLNVESERIGAYSEDTEEMLGTLAGSLAAIIANARLLQQVRRQAERERMLYEVTSRIRRSTNIQTILTTTADELTKAVGARHTQVKVAVEEQQNETETEHER